MDGSGSPNLTETSCAPFSESEQGNLCLSLSLTGISLSLVHTAIPFAPFSTGHKFLTSLTDKMHPSSSSVW